MIYFESKFGSEYPNIFTWPKIELTDREFHPTLHAREALTKSSSPIKLTEWLLIWKYVRASLLSIAAAKLFYSTTNAPSRFISRKGKENVLSFPNRPAEVNLSDRNEEQLLSIALTMCML